MSKFAGYGEESKAIFSIDKKQQKGEITDDNQPEANEVNANIEVTGSGKGKPRKVKAFLVSRSRGKTIYKAEYESSKDNMFIYHAALDSLREYANNEGLKVVSIVTNVDLPFVRNAGKRMR